MKSDDDAKLELKSKLDSRFDINIMCVHLWFFENSNSRSHLEILSHFFHIYIYDFHRIQNCYQHFAIRNHQNWRKKKYTEEKKQNCVQYAYVIHLVLFSFFFSVSFPPPRFLFGSWHSVCSSCRRHIQYAISGLGQCVYNTHLITNMVKILMRSIYCIHTYVISLINSVGPFNLTNLIGLHWTGLWI